MKIIGITITLLASMALAIVCHGQPNPTIEKQKEAMAKLAVMEGQWTGTGWMQRGQSERHTFEVKETAEKKNGGLTLLIQGLGTDSKTGEIGHDALAVVYYDVESDQYMFDSHLDTGQHKLMTGSFEGDEFIWGFDLPNNAKIKYVITFTENTWNETGEYSSDGINWFKFMEMNLNKQ